MLEILLCDDNSEYLDYLSSTINTVVEQEGIPVHIVYRAKNPREAKDFLAKGNANVFFLDISFQDNPEGLELASILRERDSNCYIVFISAHTNLVFNSLRVHPHEFLRKPTTPEQLKSCIKSIYLDFKAKNAHKSTDSMIPIKSGTVTYYINKKEIVLIERLSSRTIVHTPNKQITSYISLDCFEKLLSEDKNFIRCHRSYIANKHFIREIHHSLKQIVFSTGHACHIGNKFKSGGLVNG